MSSLHPKKPFDPADDSIQPILQKMQGNILKHHGRENAWHIFLHLDQENMVGIKTWISNLEITTAEEQLADSKAFKELVKLEEKDKTGVIATQLKSFEESVVRFFFLSKTGYDKLGADTAWMTDDPFRAGMKARGPFLEDAKPDEWDFANSPGEEIDAMLLIASDSYRELDNEMQKIFGNEPDGLNRIHIQKGEILRNEHGIGLEHFGYADGISQPLMLTTDQEMPGKTWDDVVNPQFMALVNDENAKNRNEIDKEAFGSYFVFRKLEQNVHAFKEKEEGLGFGEIGGAYIVGRFEDGTPVTKHSNELHIKSEKQFDNDFDYSNDKAGSKCPYHAHIRMTNPRDLQDKNNPIRVVRRGIPYDEFGRNGDLSLQPEEKVGLLFMCYQKSIANQFEVLQGHWANNGTINNNNPATKPSLPKRNIAIDGVIGQGDNTRRQQEYPFKWGEKPVVTKCNFKGFVTMKGGEYFFAASIPFLKNL